MAAPTANARGTSITPRIGTPASAEALFKVAELPVADFYKQLAWEVAQGHVKDNQTTLEPGHAAG